MGMATQAQTNVLEEVIVTAQKRSQSLQDVPIAVTAISGAKIAEAGILGLEDLTTYVPNVAMVENAGGGSPSSIYIRGIGSGNNRAFEQSVGMFVDGVYTGRSRQYLVPFLDVASVEVLKGPQGALFGKNTVAGAMIINSARPTDTFEAELRGRYEFEYNSKEYLGIVSGPLTDGLSGRLAAKYQDQEGYMDNLVRNTEEPEVENKSIRGSLLWDASDDVQVYAKIDYSDQDTTGNNNQFTDTSGNFRGLVDHVDVLTPLEDGKFDDKNTQNSWQEDGSDTDALNATVQLDWDLGFATLTSLTGYSDYDMDSVMDGDTSDLLFLESISHEEFDQVSQEFRLSSPGGETLDYIVGVYLESQDLQSDNVVDISLIPLSALFVPGSPVPPAELSPRGDYDQDSDTIAGFGELTWRFMDDWSLSGGVRYSDEEKDAKLTNVISDFGETEPSTDPLVLFVAENLLAYSAGELKDDRSKGKWSYSANIAWDYSEDGMTYLRYARGYKSGGFNPNNKSLDPDIFEYDDEKVDSIELGAKMTLLDGAATLNLAAFYTEMTDLQVSSFVDSGFIVGNAAESTSKGFEVEGRWMAAPWLNFAASIGYLDSEYDDFPGAPCTDDQLSSDDPVAAGCEGWTASDPGLGTTNRKGEVAGRAPEWTGTFTTNVIFPVGDSMVFRGSVDYLYEDELNERSDPNYQDSYHKINARLALGSASNTWEVAMIGKNLNDETTYATGFGAGFFTGSWAKNRMMPRTYALELLYRFQ
jgi:outer membrane receptor protein involved in Fe transport